MPKPIKTIADLTPDPQNPRKRTERGSGMLSRSLREVGAGRSIVIDEEGQILAGNGTIEAAAEVGIENVKVVDVDGNTIVAVRRSGLTEEQKVKLALYDNRTADLATYDAEILLEIDQTIDLSPFFTDIELNELSLNIEDEEEGDRSGRTSSDDDDIPEVVESRVKPGEVWKLGRHYICCSDSTVEENVRKLLGFVGGRQIDAIFTDPPYSVSYADKNASLNAVSKGNRIQTPIENDHLSVEETSEKIWYPAFSNLFKFAKPGCVYYVTAPQGGDQMMMMMLKQSGWLVKHELIWVKNNHVLGRADYHYKHEPIIYGWKPGASHYFIDSRSEFSVWNFDKPMKSDLHPTMKPIELIQYALSNSSRNNDLIADFFLGSGSTLMAAEKMQGDRTVVGFEISPAYCDVVIGRWESLSGGKARLVDSLPAKVT